jgi:hypothetical protein
MKKEFFYWLIVAIFLLLPFTASAYQFDQSQSRLSSSFSATVFAPIGQSFVPQQDFILGVMLKLSDAGGAGMGNWAEVRLRKNRIDGEVVAVSDEFYLEDCFNFIADPGCGLGGGNPAQITFLFAQPVAVEADNVYVMELVVDAMGDGLLVAYYPGDVYPEGGYYKQGMPSLDDLWFRTLAPGNPEILVSSNSQLKRFNLQGELLDSTAIPVNSSSEVARDLIRHPEQGTWIFNGTFQPVLSHMQEGVWSSFGFAGWSTANSGSYGGITSRGQFVYVTDGSTFQAGEPKGLVRFDMRGQLPPARFLTQYEYIDVTLGLDGWLYSLRNTYGTLDVIAPETMTLVRSVSLGHTSGSRAAVATADGDIYLASWDGRVYHYDRDGRLQNSVLLGSNLYDLDIHPAWGLLVSNRFGDVWRLNFALEILQNFNASQQGAFVAFADAPTELEYCHALGQNTHYEWIQSVSVNGVLITSGDNQGYIKHLQPVLDLTVSQPNTLLLTPGFRSGQYFEYWSVWVDWNRDGQFSDAEKTVSSRSNSAVLTTFDIPPGTAAGPTLMRVAMRFDAPPANCGEFYYGEVEDFIVEVKE